MRVTDPVCGKSLGLDKVVAQEDYQGWAHFFCSESCHRQFISSPERFSQMPKTASRNAG